MDLSRDDHQSLTKVNCFPHLNLNGNQLGADDIVHICKSLRTNTALKRMSAVKCDISEEGGKAIGDALMVDRSIQLLDLHDNPASAGVVHITESLRHNDSLLEIILSNCNISEKGYKAIGDALTVNRSLQLLDLHENPISAGGVHIAESLERNHSLLKINLHSCGIQEKAVEALGISLKENNILLTLMLSENYFSDGAHITDGLTHNTCLEKLDISHCGLRDRGMKSLGSALEVNSSLEELNVTWNGAVTGIGLLALGESLKRNRGLKTLRIKFNDYISDSDSMEAVYTVFTGEQSSDRALVTTVCTSSGATGNDNT